MRTERLLTRGKGIFLFTCLLVIFVSLPSLSLAQTKEPIRLGINLEITGNAAWTGEPQLRALQLLAEQTNQAGGINGRRIELVVYDNETNVEKSSSNVKKLIQRDKVIAIFGPGVNAMCRAANNDTQEAKITSYSLSASFPVNFKDSYWFGAFPDFTAGIGKFFDWFHSVGFTRVAQICSTDSSGQDWYEASLKIAQTYPGMQLSSQRFNVSDLDVTPQLTNLKAANPQALVVGSTGKSCGVVIKNFYQMGFKIPAFTGQGNISQSFLNMIAENEPEAMVLPGSKFVIYQDLPDSDPLKPLMKKFADDFKKKFNKEADNYGAVAYDAGRVFFNAIRAANPAGPEESGKIRDIVEKMKDFPGVFGAYYNFSQQDHRGLTKDVLIFIQAKNKKFSLWQK
jgi:branched-chain amino acid transport system substrate-binding protein